MNGIQTAAYMDHAMLSIFQDKGDGEIISYFMNSVKFDFYKKAKIFNLGTFTAYKQSGKNSLVPETSNWPFACLPRVTNILNDNELVFWVDADDNAIASRRIIIADSNGNVLMGFCTTNHETAHVSMAELNARRVLARGWEMWEPNGVYVA